MQTWEEKEKAWDRQAQQAAFSHPLKTPRQMPQMPGIAPGEEKGLKRKSFLWMIAKDRDWSIIRGFLRYPFRYAWRYLRSFFKKKAYIQFGDFFYYGLSSEEEWEKELGQREKLFVLGFSYCHKPFECPSGRFTDQCIQEKTHPVCQQCFIGKALFASSEAEVIPVIIPTVHAIGAKIFELVRCHPQKEILFLITACELTLHMFADWGNMVGIRGVGIRLGGRICNTIKAFQLSEQGIKPGLTVVEETTKEKMIQWIRIRANQSHYTELTPKTGFGQSANPVVG